MNVDNRIPALLILCGLCVFLFNVFFLPDWSFVDANVHLNVVKRMMAGEPFKLVAGDLFPAWYHFALGFFLLTGLPVWAWNKALALLVFSASMLILYTISRTVFPGRFLLPLAFFVGNWWVLNYSSISYIEPFLGVLLLLFFGFFLREVKGLGRSWLNCGAMLCLIAVLALSKLTGLAFAPLLLFLMVGLYFHKTEDFSGSVFLFFIVTVLLFSVWDAAGLGADGKARSLVNAVNKTAWNAGRFVLNPFRFAEQFQRAYLAVLNFPPNDCLNLAIFGGNLELVKGFFFYLFLPFAACIAYGFKKALFSREIEWVVVALIVLLGFGVIFQQWLELARYILPRYTLPVWGFLGLLFCKGYFLLRDERIRGVVFASFVLFCVYSCAYASYSTFRYFEVDVAYSPALSFVDGLPEGARVAVSSLPGSRVSLMEGKTLVKVRDVLAKDFNALGFYLGENAAGYVFIGCYREALRPADFNALSGYGRARLLFLDSCAQVWEVLDYNFDVPNHQKVEARELSAGAGAAPRLLDECH